MEIITIFVKDTDFLEYLQNKGLLGDGVDIEFLGRHFFHDEVGTSFKVRST